MAQPNSRDTLIDYCLRRLGAPVIEINIDLDQIDDKVDDALQMYQEYNEDGMYRTYISHQVTTTDVNERYVPVPADVMYITRIIPVSMGGSTNFFDIKYQMMLNDLSTLHKHVGDLSYYAQVQQYMSTLDMQLNGQQISNYSRKEDRLYIHGEWSDGELSPDEYIVLEAYRAVDPNTATKVWNDIWIKDYTTALIKQQWGTNMMKFEGMTLPGGIQFNGRQYYEDATQELEMLRTRLREEYSRPIDFLIG